MKTTYIKLDRKLLENKYFKYPGKAQQLRVWIYLLMHAAYTSKDDEDIKRYGYDHLEPGQVIRSKETIGRDLRLKNHQVKAALDALKKDNMITTKSSNKNTLITIVNWAVYQGKEKQNDQQNDHQNDQRRATKMTTKMTTNKEYKEIPYGYTKNKKNTPGPPSPSAGVPDGSDGYGAPPPGWDQECEEQFLKDKPYNPRQTRLEWWQFWKE